jgi:hypothetical protein
MFVNKFIHVSITWIRPEDGGRKALISSPSFGSNVWLEGDDIKRVWSFPMEFKSIPTYEKPTEAIASFLTDECPWEKLYKDAVLHIRDGVTHTIGYCRVFGVYFINTAGKLYMKNNVHSDLHIEGVVILRTSNPNEFCVKWVENCASSIFLKET